MTHSPTVVSRNGQVHRRDPETHKATGPLLGWVERDPENRRCWIAQSIAGGRIATEKATRREALRLLLSHVSVVQTPRMAATVNTGSVKIRNKGSLIHWGHHIGAWIAGLAMVGTAGLFAYAVTLS